MSSARPPKPRIGKSTNVNMTPRSRAAMKGVVNAIQAEGMSYMGAQATQEAVVNAVWLWLDEKMKAEVVGALPDYLRRVEKDVLDRSRAVRSGGGGLDAPEPESEAGPGVGVPQPGHAPVTRGVRAGKGSGRLKGAG